MSQCEITFKNNIPNAKTYPKLMTELLVYTNYNTAQALDLYGLTLLDEFKSQNVKPTLKNILAFNQADNIVNSKNLNNSDRIDILNLSTTDKNIEDFKTEFLNVFTVDGIFGVDIEKIKNSEMFSGMDILELDNYENISKIKNLYYKLNATDETFNTVKYDVVLGKGLFDKLNPDMILTNLYNNYIGLTTKEEILNKANEIGDEVVLNNPELIKKILVDLRNKQSIPSYETDEYSGDIVEKKESTYTRLEQTIDVKEDYNSILNQIEFIKELPAGYFVTDTLLVERYLDNIKKQSAEKGIDLSNIDEIFYNKSYNEIMDFLDSYYNVLIDIQRINDDSLKESLKDFSDAYDLFFNKETKPVIKIVDKINREGNFINIETNRSEEKLFEESSVIKVKDNIYQRIDNTKSLEELYDLILQNDFLLPKGTLSVKNIPINNDLLIEDLDKYVSTKANDYLRDESDVNNIKKLTAYKILLSIKDNPSTRELGVSKEINIEEFIIEFNKELINNKQLSELFYISNRGIEAKTIIGEYSFSLIKNLLSDNMFDSLVTYSKLSGNESLEYFSNQYSGIDNVNQRDFFANNLHQLDNFKGKYVKKDNLIYAPNSISDFIKVNNALYEKVDTNTYAKVDTSDRYMNYNLQKPDYTPTTFEEVVADSSGKIKVKETREINDNQIKFC